MCYYVACCMDKAKVAQSEQEKDKWNGYVELLIPVVKAYTTDKGFLICSMAMDVLGGYGYCSEYPIEQYLRDEKIAAIYEGTNGIQAMDLLGRKLRQRNGDNNGLFQRYRRQCRRCEKCRSWPHRPPFWKRQPGPALLLPTLWLRKRRGCSDGLSERGAVSGDFLRRFDREFFDRCRAHLYR